MFNGRPTLYTPELAERICERLASGETLRAICNSDDIPAENTVRGWARDKESPFYAQYTRAREIGYHRMADDVVEIADDKLGDPSRDRLRFDARRWLLSKALPKIYGDKLAIGGDEENPLRHIHEIKRSIVDP